VMPFDPDNSDTWGKNAESKHRLEENLRLDEAADLHARVSAVESNQVRLSRRITALEEANRGNFSDDPLAGILSPGMITLMVVLTLAPIVVEMIKQWRSSSSSRSLA
jgi:hypothetical protein